MTDVAGRQMAELQSPYERELIKSFRNDSLHLVLLPTEQCNFRCAYCYEDFAMGRMAAETVQGVKRLIDRRLNDLNLLNISWFGGEPLLARPIIEDISEHIKRTAIRNPELCYFGDMTTNGYLLDAPVLNHLADLGIRQFQISLDGPEALHDGTRIRANGKGSFQQIWRNLLMIRDGAAPVEVLLRVHLTLDNLPTMPEFLARIKSTFLHDRRFKVLLRPVERLGGPNDDQMPVIPKRVRAQVFAELEAIVLDRVDSSGLFSPTEICYASRPNSFVIRADGRVGKCTVALRDPRNTIGRLLPDGSLEVNDARLRLWMHGWASHDWRDLECPYGGLALLDNSQPNVVEPDAV